MSSAMTITIVILTITMSRAHSPTFLSLHLRHNSFSNPSVALPTSQLILQLLHWFTYVTVHSPTLTLVHLRLSSFSNPFSASPTSLALHLRHLASRPCISTLVTKFSQNIVADTDKNKALIDWHKSSSSFLSIVKSHPHKIPASLLEKVGSGSCLKLFLIDCKCNSLNCVHSALKQTHVQIAEFEF